MIYKPVTNKRVLKMAERRDYWKRFKYKGRVFVKTFQNVREVTKGWK